jgi:hypothetical protein
MGKMKTRAENRCNSIDLFLNGIAPPFSPAHTQDPEQLQNEDYLNEVYYHSVPEVITCFLGQKERFHIRLRMDFQGEDCEEK